MPDRECKCDLGLVVSSWLLIGNRLGYDSFTQGLRWTVSLWHYPGHCFLGQSLLWLAFVHLMSRTIYIGCDVHKIYKSFNFQVISGINRGSSCGHHM